VVLLAQLGRKVEDSSPPIPTLSHIKETGEAEQTADTVIMVYRQDYYADQNKLKVIDKDLEGIGRFYIGKSRHGPTGWIDLEWCGANTTYRNLTRQQKDHWND
jgi:replicative DNA helicase